MSTREELKDYIVNVLKKTYFNARTDVVAEKNGLVPDGSPHALTVIEYQAEDVLKNIDNFNNGREINND